MEGLIPRKGGVADGAVTIRNGSPGTVDVIADVAGYHTTASNAAFATCESLDTLPLGQTIVNGPRPPTVSSRHSWDIPAHPFVFADGVTQTTLGLGQVVNQGRAGGSNAEIRLNNITASTNT